MATVKDWLAQKFNAWEKTQGGRQSYYAFARYLEVSQSGLGAWMNGDSVRPNIELQQLTVSIASLPADLRQRLTGAIVEVDQELRQRRLRPDDAAARPIVLAVLEKWGFRYTD